MTAVVAELESQLQSMLEMKPPGANQQKITSVTTHCNANIKNETVLIQKLYTHFKKAPANYKLGALYVVDSIARSWLDQAKKSGQELGPSAADGTFAAGVHHITELLPSFMSDITATAPEEHKAKIKKLIDIWKRGSTFPTQMIASFEEKLTSPAARSTTPTGTPPQSAVNLAANALSTALPSGAMPASSNNLAETLKALAGMAQGAGPAPSSVPAPTPTPNSMQMPQGSYPQGLPVNGAPVQFPSVGGQQPPSMNGLNGFSGGANGNNALAQLLAAQQPQNQQLPQQTGFPALQQQQQQALPSVPQAGISGMQNLNPDTLKQIQILQQLKAANIPQENWAALLPYLLGAQSSAPAGVPAPTNQGSFPTYTGMQADQSRDYGYDQMRSPRGRDGNRSRSPNRSGRREASPIRRRDSPTYGRYGTEEREREGRGRRDRGGRDRRRSPERFRRSPSPRHDQDQHGDGSDYQLPPPGPKKIEYDPSLPEGNIRVFSRTLFVGGVTCSEEQLRKIFSQYGLVQTCIVNIDKRHAFVKMINRDEAAVAKDAMEHYRGDNMQLRTRWGVGYGPRDCSDYGTGISVIPIHRLTDADRKWMLTAEYGGSGGKPIETGLVVEEPDIEIGAGVSSKAISRRMQTDRSGQHGPRSSRDSSGRNRSGKDDDNPNNISVAPSVPGYGFNFMSQGANAVPLGMNQGFAQAQNQ